MSDPDIAVVCEHILSTKDNFISAFKIKQAMPAAIDRIIKQWGTRLGQKFTQAHPEAKVSCEHLHDQKWAMLSITNKAMSDVDMVVALHFDKNNYSDVAFGVSNRAQEKIDTVSDTMQKIYVELNNSFRHGKKWLPWWAWYEELPSPHRDWNNLDALLPLLDEEPIYFNELEAVYLICTNVLVSQ